MKAKKNLENMDQTGNIQKKKRKGEICFNTKYQKEDVL
jgi:hypothetical protein